MEFAPGVQLLRPCPLCSATYSYDRVVVLAKVLPAYLVHITCPECQNATLSIITVSDFGLSSIGVYTDLTAGDVERVYNQPPISEEEIFDFYERLEADPQVLANWCRS